VPSHAVPSHAVLCACSMYNGYESHVDVNFDLVYFTLGHLRRPGQVQVPKGSGDTR